MTKDKKQIIVIGSLGAVLVAVGAFQFLSGPKVEIDVDSEENSAEAVEQQARDILDGALTRLVPGDLSPRDPFQPVGWQAPPEPAGVTQPTTPTMGSGGGSRPSGGGSGFIPPMNPLPGGFPGLGGSFPDPNSGIGLLPQAGAPPISGSGYAVKGVVVGDKPMAVFEDSAGNQRLVPLGGSIDGDTQVTSIERGKVTVKHRGKEKTLTIEEGSN